MTEQAQALLAAGAFFAGLIQFLRLLVSRKWPKIPVEVYAVLHMVASVAYCHWAQGIPFDQLVEPVMATWGTGVFAYRLWKGATKAVPGVPDWLVPDTGADQ